MTQVKKFLAKWWLLVALSFIATLLGILKLSTNQPILNPPSPQINPLPSPVSRSKPKAIWQDIIPGETTKDDLIEKLGEPINQKKEENFSVYEFSSKSKVRPHQVFLDDKNEKVSLIKEQITKADNKNFSFFTQTYGQPEEILYGPHAVAGFQVAVYYQSGLAIVNSPIDGTVLEVWYFKPTTQENFLETWGKDLEKEKPEIID